MLRDPQTFMNQGQIMKSKILSAVLEVVESEVSHEQHILHCAQHLAGDTSGDDFAILNELLEDLSNRSSIPVPDLFHRFAKRLVGEFAATSQESIAGIETSFEFLSRIDEVMHFASGHCGDAEGLPRFSFKAHDGGCLELTCRSAPAFEGLAGGLIKACAEYFDEDILIEQRTVEDVQGKGTRFYLQRNQRDSSVV